MAADAKSTIEIYLRVVRTTVLPVIRRYWFDVLVIAAAIGGALELVLNRDAPDAPTVPLAASIPLEVGLTLMLLGRRRFPFAAPAGMLVAGAALSFWEGSSSRSRRRRS
jgi:hypothetical protein